MSRESTDAARSRASSTANAELDQRPCDHVQRRHPGRCSEKLGHIAELQAPQRQYEMIVGLGEVDGAALRFQQHRSAGGQVGTMNAFQ